MGQLGFSYVGLIFLLMLFVPNLIWAKHQPIGYSPAGENKVLLALERVGQVLVSGTALVFTDFNPRFGSWWTLWLVGAFLLMILYECWWVRYFKSEKTLADFYSSFLFFPVAGATLPVLAFFLLGVYGKNLLLLVSVIVLGVGHIGIHLAHRKKLPQDR